MRLLDLMAAPILRKVWQIGGVEISATDLDRLRLLRKSHALTVANHPTLAEPLVLYVPFRRARLTYGVMTAWDTITAGGRLSAWLFQRIGCYSVRRGRRDRASMEMTEKLLVEGQRVVLFPEGQTYGLNDLMLPFQEGALLMAFRAAEEMERRGIAAPLLLVPCAIKYVYERSMLDEITASLGRLEAALRLPSMEAPPYVRLRRIAEESVARVEREEGVTPDPSDELDERILAVRQRMAAALAEALGAELSPDAEFPVLVQALANAYDDYSEKAGGAGVRAAEADALRRRWLKLKTFVGFRDHYVREWPSAERYVDVLSRLETDLFGKSGIRGLRRAVVRVGEPLDVKPHLPAYRASRREALSDLTRQIEERVKTLLLELVARTERPDELRPE